MIVALLVALTATQAVLIYGIWSAVALLQHLDDITGRSLRVRGGPFAAFSPHEIMDQTVSVEACRKRLAELPAGEDEETVKKRYDLRFDLEAAENVLGVMLAGNHDAVQKPDAPFWTRERVRDRHDEFQPHGKRWIEHEKHRESHIHARCGKTN